MNSPDPLTHTEKIVVLNVDDYEAGRYATTRTLQQAGFNVVEAATGQEAVEVAARARPDLVVLDVNLPDVNGFEVCRRIKNRPDTADIPVLYLSAAYRAPEHRVQGLELGADGYLTQPTDPRELVATVNALLRARHVRAAVRQNEERFRALLVATSDVIWTTDPSGAIVEELPDWAEFTGTEFEQYRGWGWLNSLHPDDRARTSEIWARALEDRTLYETEYRMRRRDGQFRHMAVRGVPVQEADGTLREWVGACTDISERKHASEELAERTERLAFLSDAATRLLLTADPRDYIEHLFEQLSVYLELEIYFNYLVTDTGTLRLHAYSGVEPDAIGERVEIRSGDAISGHVAATREPLVVEDIAGSDDPRVQVLRELGVTAYAAFPLASDDQLTGTLAFGTRSRSHFDEDELSLLRTVCTQVAVAVERTRLIRELQERARALEEANRAKSDFLATMSHELRTPLNAMIGYADLLLLGVPDPIPEGSRDQVERIRGAATHLTQLIEEVLTHARLEAGRDELHLEEVDLNALVGDVSTLMEPLARQKGLRFVLALDPDLPVAFTDPRKVRQILLNLLGNAVKFTEQGEVRLDLACEGDQLHMAVRDTGIGIPAAQLHRVFEPFWQVDNTKTRRMGGTGLGLGVVQQLAKRLGGSVRVESEEGRGSTFLVRLPVRTTADTE